MIGLHVVAALLATCRLTEIITQERISQWVRQKWPLYLWTCPRCVSVWSAIAATAAFVYMPFLNWPLALSWLYIVQAQILPTLLAKIDPKYDGIRKVSVALNAKNELVVERADFDSAGLANILARLMESMRQRENELLKQIRH